MPLTPQAPSLFFDHPLYWLACGSVIVAVMYGSIFFHELGHWLMGKLCGYQILGFSVGEGKLLWEGELAQCFVQLRLLPVEGHVIAVKASGEETRLQHILLSAGGPIFSAILMTVAAALYHWGNFAFLGATWGTLVSQTVAIITVLLGFEVLFNLWPRHANLGGKVIANDGMSILSALLSRDYPEPHWYLARLRNAFGDSDNDERSGLVETQHAAELFLEAHAQYWKGDTDKAIAGLQSGTKIPGLTAHEQAFFLGEIATFAVRQKELQDTALECCERAHEMFPENDHFACQLGYTQIYLRFYDRGRRLLEELLERSQDNQARASALCTLALADAAQKRREDGLQRTREARKLYPFCPLLPLARAALLGGTPGFDGK